MSNARALGKEASQPWAGREMLDEESACRRIQMST
jgi:hypothetical protein